MHYTFYINYLWRGASHHTTSASGEYRKQFGMMAIKIERARTHFLSDVFTPVANVGSVILPTELEVLTPVSEVSRIQWRIRGESPGGFGSSLPDLTLVWDWNSYIDRIVYHFLTGWFFQWNARCILPLNKIPGILKNVIVFGYSPLLAKQYFPRERRPALTEEDVPRVYISFTGASVKGKGSWNYNVQPRPAGGGWVVFVGEK